MAESPQPYEDTTTNPSDAAASGASEKLWTPANIITLIRICLVPLFLIVLICPWPEWMGLPDISLGAKRYMAAGIFIFISCTDWLDGYLARSRNEVTDFGKFMDPLADKILVAAALLALIELGSLPSWVALIILAREFIVSGVRMVAASNGVVIAASYIGKFKTVFQMIAIVLFTIKDAHNTDTINVVLGDTLWLVSWGVMIIALILTIVSMLDYIVKARDLIGLGSPSTSAKAATTSAPPAEASDGALSAGARSSLAPSSRDEHESVPGDQPVDDNLAERIIHAAESRHLTIGCAESLTGGLIASALTSVSGSSSVVRGCIVSYVNDIKNGLLSVDAQILSTEGAVCATVAEQMAVGAKQALACDIAVAVTGIAGPTGAEEGKPVGTVFMGIATPEAVSSTRFQFAGDRESVRAQTVHEALRALLLEVETRS